MSVPWLAQYDFSSPGIPSGFRLGRFKGLAHLLLFRGEDGVVHLVTYWESRDSYQAQGPFLEQALGLSSPRMAGLVSDSHWRRSWKPRTLDEWLVKGSALVGAFTVASGGYWALFAGTNLLLEPQSLGVVNVLENKPIPLPVDITNQHSKASCDVTITATSSSGSLRVRPASVSTLSSGETKTVVATARFTAAGTHAVQIEGVAHGGWFNPFSQRTQATIDVIVWKRKVETAFRAVSATGKTCTLLASLRIGEAQPNGLICEASAVRPADLRFRAVMAPRLGQWEDVQFNPEPGKETMSLRWTMEALSAFEEIPLRIYMDAPRTLTSADCDEFARNRMTWLCERP